MGGSFLVAVTFSSVSSLDNMFSIGFGMFKGKLLCEEVKGYLRIEAEEVSMFDASGNIYLSVRKYLSNFFPCFFFFCFFGNDI